MIQLTGVNTCTTTDAADLQVLNYSAACLSRRQSRPARGATRSGSNIRRYRHHPSRARSPDEDRNCIKDHVWQSQRLRIPFKSPSGLTARESTASYTDGGEDTTGQQKRWSREYVLPQ